MQPDGLAGHIPLAARTKLIAKKLVCVLPKLFQRVNKQLQCLRQRQVKDVLLAEEDTTQPDQSAWAKRLTSAHKASVDGVVNLAGVLREITLATQPAEGICLITGAQQLLDAALLAEGSVVWSKNLRGEVVALSLLVGKCDQAIRHGGRGGAAVGASTLDKQRRAAVGTDACLESLLDGTEAWLQDGCASLQLVRRGSQSRQTHPPHRGEVKVRPTRPLPSVRGSGEVHVSALEAAIRASREQQESERALVDVEWSRVQSACRDRGMIAQAVPEDGDCVFHAVAWALNSQPGGVATKRPIPHGATAPVAPDKDTEKWQALQIRSGFFRWLYAGTKFRLEYEPTGSKMQHVEVPPERVEHLHTLFTGNHGPAPTAGGDRDHALGYRNVVLMLWALFLGWSLGDNTGEEVLDRKELEAGCEFEDGDYSFSAARVGVSVLAEREGKTARAPASHLTTPAGGWMSIQRQNNDEDTREQVTNLLQQFQAWVTAEDDAGRLRVVVMIHDWDYSVAFAAATEQRGNARLDLARRVAGYRSAVEGEASLGVAGSELPSALCIAYASDAGDVMTQLLCDYLTITTATVTTYRQDGGGGAGSDAAARLVCVGPRTASGRPPLTFPATQSSGLVLLLARSSAKQGHVSAASLDAKTWLGQADVVKHVLGVLDCEAADLQARQTTAAAAASAAAAAKQLKVVEVALMKDAKATIGAWETPDSGMLLLVRGAVAKAVAVTAELERAVDTLAPHAGGRLTYGFFGPQDSSCTWGQHTFQALTPAPAVVTKLLAVAQQAGVPHLNAVLVVRLEKGGKLGEHRDGDQDLVQQGRGIVSVSLGGPAFFNSRREKSDNKTSVRLDGGDVLIFDRNHLYDVSDVTSDSAHWCFSFRALGPEGTPMWSEDAADAIGSTADDAGDGGDSDGADGGAADDDGESGRPPPPSRGGPGASSNQPGPSPVAKRTRSHGAAGPSSRDSNCRSLVGEFDGAVQTTPPPPNSYVRRPDTPVPTPGAAPAAVRGSDARAASVSALPSSLRGRAPARRIAGVRSPTPRGTAERRRRPPAR
ncbi:MAG: alpha-ketoglutarate-dependent dioxygenase AlkB [Myxococcales bacterium]|nr:alpha-ketoglutarate-dependent dioxygenase AlkB [Myxococcales bacterium]